MEHISDLKFDHKNARKRTDSSARLIQESLQRYGAARSIVIDEDNRILAGNGTIEAAKALGLAKLKVVEAAGDEIIAVRRSGLSEDDKVGLALADNRAAELSDWDAEMLQQLSEEHDIAPWFEQEDLDALLQEVEQLEPVEGNTDPDEVPEPPAEPITKPGDLWILGNHRLLCGDSTNIQHVERLMDGNGVDLIFTDPPYNVAFNGRSGKHDVIKNDNLSTEDFDQFIGEVLQTIKTLNAPAYYIWCNWKFYATLQRELEYKSCIVWAKNVFGMGVNYRHQHEFCLFNGSIDEDIKNESDLWEVKKDTNYVHPTQKPVALSQRALGNHRRAKNVLDLFGGSGSTLIGCETMKRRAFVMELDPRYCDVIVKRWEDFTGNTAICEPSEAHFAAVCPPPADHFTTEQQEAF
jgi:DNA modification methylase